MTHDIEAVIDEVSKLIPEVVVVQMSKTFDADDDGLWWFRLPGVDDNIQIESSSHDCPFLAEHSSMQTSAEAMTCATVAKTVLAVVDYLEPRRHSKR